MSQELQTWVEQNGFGKFFEKLVEAGVESLDDLRILKDEAEVQELAGPEGIKLGVVFRRKFIRAVMQLKGDGGGGGGAPQQVPPQQRSNAMSATSESASETAVISPRSSPDPDPQVVVQKRKSVMMGKEEENCLLQLVNTIRTHTKQLKKAKENLTNVKQQAADARVTLIDVFDKSMGILVARRKALENALNLAESEVSTKLKKRIDELQDSAKLLLTSKKAVEAKLSTPMDDVQRAQRRQYVVTTIMDALQKAPKSEMGSLNIIFDQGETPLTQFIEGFGSVRVGKRKSQNTSSQVSSPSSINEPTE